MERSPNGVAKVETQLSFANQLVYALTWGIYAPMEIVVTCAAAPSGDTDLVDDGDDFKNALELGSPFLVSLR